MTPTKDETIGFLYTAMFRGLIEAAIFTNEEQLCEEAETDYNHQPACQGDWQLSKASISIADFAPSAIAYLEDLCRNFESAFAGFCIKAEEYRITELRDHTELEAVGHDLWNTINRLGAGFLDGNWDESMSEKLDVWCKQQSEISLYFSDDLLIYIGGKEDYAS